MDGQWDSVVPALRRGLPVHVERSSDQRTLAHAAALWSQVPAMTIVLGRGGSANAQDSMGITPLLLAAQHGSPDILQLLVDAGGDVNLQGGLGHTPLMCAVGRTSQAQPCVRLLLGLPQLDLGKCYMGATAEEWALKWGHPDLAELIQEEVRVQPLGRQGAGL